MIMLWLGELLTGGKLTSAVQVEGYDYFAERLKVKNIKNGKTYWLDWHRFVADGD